MGSRSLLEAKAVLIFGEIFLVLLGWLMYCWAMVAIRMSNIATTHQSIPFIKDGGLLIVEDVHASYFKDFGNPSKYSFINYAKLFIDDINARFPGIEVIKNIFGGPVYSADFYDSIVAFSVDLRKCFVSSWTSYEGQTFEAEDYRHHDSLARKINQALIGAFKKVGIKFSMGKFLKLIEGPVIKARLKNYFE
jgi:hypothetical protein